MASLLLAMDRDVEFGHFYEAFMFSFSVYDVTLQVVLCCVTFHIF